MLLRFLGFLNLLDSSRNLSITNLAVIVCVVKMACSTQMSGAEVGALLVAIGNYIHKRTVNDANQ